jgi:hypothetical protein
MVQEKKNSNLKKAPRLLPNFNKPVLMNKMTYFGCITSEITKLRKEKSPA